MLKIRAVGLIVVNGKWSCDYTDQGMAAIFSVSTYFFPGVVEQGNITLCARSPASVGSFCLFMYWPQIRFLFRLQGILKKAAELSILTGTQVTSSPVPPIPPPAENSQVTA